MKKSILLLIFTFSTQFACAQAPTNAESEAESLRDQSTSQASSAEDVAGTEIAEEQTAPTMVATSSVVANKTTSKSIASKSEAPKSVAEAQKQKLIKLNRKYIHDGGVKVDLEKVTTTAMLGRERKAEGTLTLNKGKVRLETTGPEKTLIIVNDSDIWVVNYPPENFKDVPLQVVKSDMKKQKKNKIGLAKILTGDGIFDVFRVSGMKEEEGGHLYFLQPLKDTDEFKRAQLLTDKDSTVIKEIRYWDQLDNQTRYIFRKSVFKAKIDPQLFVYQPPKDAQITTY